MASNITDGVSFNITNMKPDPDEEISALWGQNIADNTGYLYYKDEFAGNFHGAFIQKWVGGSEIYFSNSIDDQKLFFTKTEPFDYLNGTMFFAWDGNHADDSGTFNISVDGTAKVYSKSLSGSSPSSAKETLNWDMSHIANNSVVEVEFSKDYSFNNSSGLPQMSTSANLWKAP